MRNTERNKNKIYAFFAIISMTLLISPMISLSTAELNTQTNETIEFSQSFSEPIVEKNDRTFEVEIEEANSRIFIQGSPDLPVFRKTYELNWNAEILSINFSHSEIETIDLSEEDIKTVPVFEYMKTNTVEIKNDIKSIVKKDSNGFYPEEWYEIEKSAGLNEEGEHVKFLTISIYPSRYSSDENILEYITNAEFDIEYTQTNCEFNDPDIYDLTIITPAYFKDNLTDLINHKNSFGVKTNLTTLEDIYENFEGRDNQEQIKYFVKYAVEEWGVEYVLLVGEIRKTPIRQTDAYPWHEYHGSGILSDLYYADIYDFNYNFSSWDTNNDNIFGQIEYDWQWNNINVTIIDEVDLYPDVHIGRLACRNKEEVDTVVRKIITYETETYGKEWFKRIVLAGGDTFPPGKGSPAFEYEGEINNAQVFEELEDKGFKDIKLWASKRNLNAFTFNRAINKGAGFLSYAGHGFEHGWGTYKPNAIRENMGLTHPLYYTPFINFLRNQEKLPIIFFDACLTAKLDFNLRDLADYYKPLDMLVKLTGVKINQDNHLPCFAWRFLMEKDGGAVATIGATRPAYSFVDKEGVHAGAGYLDWMFFKGYNEGKTVGEMFTYSQNSYLKDRFKDYFTIEEYLLLGDPSLKVGGYPPQ